MKRTIIIAVCICCIMLLGSCVKKNQTQSHATFKTMKVSSRDLTLKTSYTAAIRGKQDISILPQVSGFIIKLCVTEGQRVKSGQTLFVIDQVNYQAALRVAEANVKAAKALVATNQLTYNSKKKLFEENVVSQFDLQLAENNLLTAKAQLAQAEAGEVNATNNLSYTVVKSPCDGVVGKLPFREGSLVSPQMTEALTTVSDNSQMYIYFSMTEAQVLQLTNRYGSIDKAMEEMPDLQLLLCDNSIYAQKGRVESISGVIDPSTGSVSVRAVFPNPDRVLISGGSCNVLMPYETKGAMVIPQTATYEIQNKTYAYKVVDGKAVATMIGVSSVSDGKEYIVTEGLQQGDVIIAEGAGLVREGESVTVL